MTSGAVKNEALEIGLRVLNAYNNRAKPAASDESYLRELTGDATTPADELACQIVDAELRKLRARRMLTAAG